MEWLVKGVSINGKAAYVYFVSPGQLNVLAPADTMLGSAPVQVTYNGAASSVVYATLTAASPAVFMFDPQGQKWREACTCTRTKRPPRSRGTAPPSRCLDGQTLKSCEPILLPRECCPEPFSRLAFTPGHITCTGLVPASTARDSFAAVAFISGILPQERAAHPACMIGFNRSHSPISNRLVSASGSFSYAG